MRPFCKLSKTGQCKHGGKKHYNYGDKYGFCHGMTEYCSYSKKWVHDLYECPLPAKKATPST